ncbi:hypothetical protein [Kribbella sp. NPDC051620]
MRSPVTVRRDPGVFGYEVQAARPAPARDELTHVLLSAGFVAGIALS